MSRRWLVALLLVPLAYAAVHLSAPPALTFAAGAAAIVPLAEWIRRATEQVAARAGSAIGGLLNVTFGNVAELILALFVLAAGNATVVKAQITGSMIGNSLLGLGLAILAGAWKRDKLTFSRERAGLLSSLLILATIALLLPAIFDYTERSLYATRDASMLDEHLSLVVAPVLVLVSWALGTPMNLVFDNPIEMIAIAGIAFAVNAIAHDGEATWFEGVLLLAVYCLLALAFFFAAPAS
jgi:Ca2+:H+ antiporter